MKLVPVRNPAERALRDNGLGGMLLVVIGFIFHLGAHTVLHASMAIMGSCMIVLGVLTALPSLVARGIRSERESRGSA